MSLPTMPNSSPPGVPLIDVLRHYEPLADRLQAALARICASGSYILGPEVELLEKELAAYCQTEHAIACASGSDALLLALMGCGVGQGDEVILPSYTFFATASAAWRLGARPVFVDIEPCHYNLDPELIERRITPRTKAIVPVHLYGQCAEMTPILDIARRHRLTVIEDAAQAIGAEEDGRRASSMGDIACLSFYPTKNLGAMGDGGMLLCQRPEIAERLRLLRGHGMQPRYYHKVVGINSRLDAMQAAILRVKLPHLDDWTIARQANAQRYTQLFTACGLDRTLGLPSARPNVRHVWNQYIVRIPDNKRDELREHLKQSRIGSEIYYPVPLHLQDCFASLGYKPGSLPESERAARESLALPIFPELTAEEQSLVVGQIAAFFGASAPTSGHAVKGPKYLQAGPRVSQR
jgi:dTDP-4-amino-4,6-dideoxygalactose transaminase